MKGLSRFVELPLGMSEMCGAKEAHWIASAASAALGVMGSIFGASKAARERRRQMRALQKNESEEKAWYDKAYNTDYLDTKAGQNLLRRAQEVQDNYIRKADGSAAVGGGTAASVAMAKEAANRTMGNTIANIGANDTARKQQVEDQHRQNRNEINKQRADLSYQAAINTTTAAQNMSNAMMSAAGMLEGTGKSKVTSVQTTPPFVPSTSGGNASDENVLKQKLLNQATGLM